METEERLTHFRASLVERTRLRLRLRHKLKKESKEPTTPLSPCAPKRAIPDEVKLNEKETAIAEKIIALIKRRIPMNKEPPTGLKSGKDSDDSGCSTNGSRCTSNSPSQSTLDKAKSKSESDLRDEEEMILKRTISGGKINAALSLIPEVNEVRISRFAVKSGYIEFMEKTKKDKRWAIFCRPYLLLFNDEKDLVMRGAINLHDAKVDYNKDQHMSPNSFSICTAHKGYWLLAPSEKEMHDWVYAMRLHLPDSTSRT